MAGDFDCRVKQSPVSKLPFEEEYVRGGQARKGAPRVGVAKTELVAGLDWAQGSSWPRPETGLSKEC